VIAAWVIGALLPAALEIEGPPCRPPWFDEAQLLGLLALETSSTAVERLILESPDCATAPHTIRVRWVRPAFPDRERLVPLAELDERVRLRVLALVIAEMFADPGLLPAPTPPVVQGRPTPPAVEAPRAPVGHLSLSLRHFPSGATTLYGGRIGYWPLRDLFPLGVELGLETGANQGGLGRARVLLASVAIRSELRWERQGWAVSLGPRVEAGAAFISGQAERSDVRPRSVRDLVILSDLSARLAVGLAPELWLIAEVALGWALRGLAGTAAELDLVGVFGPYGGMNLGVAAAW
jgi:hypothetical protein